MRYLYSIFFLIFLFEKNICLAQSKLPHVVATASMMADMTKNIAGDKIILDCIVPIGADPHTYEPTPRDVRLVYDAQLILKNGLSFEGWLSELIENSGTKANIVTITEGIVPIISEKFHNSTDPHAWMTANNGLIYALNIKNALVVLDPKNKNYYEANYQIYKQKLENLDEYIQKRINEIPEKKRVLITSHDAFHYYGKRYGIQLESILGISTDAEAQTSDVERVGKIIKERGVSAVFMESTINPKLLNQIAQGNNISIGGQLFADSIGDEKSDAPSYLDLLKHNTDTIVAALTNPPKANEKTHISKHFLFFLGLLSFFALLLIGGFIFFNRKKTIKNEAVSQDWDARKAIKVKGLSVSYDKKRVLTNIHIDIEKGKICGILGPNGAGKSTLFKAILGLVETNAGEILINGKTLLEGRNDIAYVPQKNDVDWQFPATVEDIVLMGRYPHKKMLERINENDVKIAFQAMCAIDIQNLKDCQIGELSGGQQQRVFIARALAQGAEIFFLDEPFVGVDVTTEQKIINLLQKLAAEGKTLLVVHHDLATVERYFDNVVLINQRLIAAGETKTTFTKENIAKTYSAQLAVLHVMEKDI